MSADIHLHVALITLIDPLPQGHGWKWHDVTIHEPTIKAPQQVM